MRILYGVVGEGMGHAMRSRVILDELAKRHEVLVVVSGRAHAYLEEALRDRLRLQRIWGLNIVYEDNEVRRFRTVLANARGAVRGWPENVRAYFRVARSFEPDVVVSDFESWSHLFARRHRLPVVSLDNIQVIDRCEHPPEVLAGHRTDFRLTRQLVRRKVPGAAHYHITSFFHPPVVRERTTLHPPVLRPRVLEAEPAPPGEHLLVYQTSTTNTRLPAILRETGLPCRVYGLRRDLETDEADGTLLWRPFDEATFVEDLRTARGVISSAGFTLMSEAVHLGRPLLAVPTRGQFEQVLNARWLQHLGYGRAAEALDAATVGAFLDDLPRHQEALAGYQRSDNRPLLAALEATLARVAGPEAAPEEPGPTPEEPTPS